MDAKIPKTLLDLAIQSLLRNESIAIQALEDMPRVFFVPLFIAAFEGGHKNILSEMVKVWPYYCLHIGSLTVQEPQHELLKAMIENLPAMKVEVVYSRYNGIVFLIQPSFFTSFLLFSPYRVLPPGLNFLYLTFCDLSHRDFRFLAQSPQVSRLKLLNLSNNPMYWDDFEPFQTLLVNLSGTLRHLEMNHCLINDIAISVLIPALIRCTQLRVLCFASNPITMPMLVTIMNNLTPLKNLKYVIYPIPVHCYGLWPFQGSLDRRKLAIVQLHLKVMLVLAERPDMNWITYLE
nr:leucine-rich repeat-containing protein 14-like [Peromyscus maniculatus bairdii]